MSKMFVNVIHRADRGAAMLEGLRFQQDEAHRAGIRTTILMSYEGLCDPDMIAYVQSQHALGDEVGIHFHNMMCEEMLPYAESDEQAIYLHATSSKQKIIDRIFEVFQDQFGFVPTAVGGYILDTEIVLYIKEKYPQVKTAITNCFEEGVKMFEGNNGSWYLFSDGGPWGAFQPSKYHHLAPGRNEQHAIDLVALPHLNRDMVLALTSRDDYFASHPANVMRAKANDGPNSPYMRRFIDQWIEQKNYNGFAYYSVFVSTPWVVPGNIFVDDVNHSRALYIDSLQYLKEKKERGEVDFVTMTEFAEVYKELVPVGTPEVNLWKDILCGTKRQTYWYVDAYFRAAIDLNIGGVICDFRPYVGEVAGDMGPDTDILWDGNYPYVIAREHRGHSGHRCRIQYGELSASIEGVRAKGRVAKSPEGKQQLIVEPIRVQVGELEVTLESIFTFVGEGRIGIERRVLELSVPNASITISEVFDGCYGTTDYPENMRGIELTAASSVTDEVSTLPYTYRSKEVSVEAPSFVAATIPQISTRISLIPFDSADRGSIKEGVLFKPYFKLMLEQQVQQGGAMRTWLTVEKQ
ncbi:hypothetical protein A8709_13610 [Paenibacillus pectinilyticus]|uniref:Uncharacterized protein n=1 Tax=Paenibacillus pectinilyticus TaxID=512399 RepID=A0A1C1A3T2_9BACL|nr:hypothetical protein [Paenibacillus pectinilyticus]OCT15140.1 hypothetical protein A8709_13610 [Paenibacillus pectinilyticus]